MSETVLRVEKLENGFEVEALDPKIEAENAKPKSSYKSPWKAYAFTSADDVVNFIKQHLSTLPKSSQEEFDTAAKEAFKE